MSPTHSLPWLKRFLGRLPWTAELYQRAGIRSGPPTGGYLLEDLESRLPDWIDAVESVPKDEPEMASQRVLVVGYLSWWVENTAALSLLLERAGHNVTLGFLPYRRWWTDQLAFDVRRQRAYLRAALAPLETRMDVVDLLDLTAAVIPEGLMKSLERQSELDVQYTLQREDVSSESGGEAGELYRMRLDRNQAAAARLLALLEKKSFDRLVIPNGSILEFGALRRAAEFANLPFTTYEYGEQRNRLWLDQGGEVMRLNTDDLWDARGDAPLTADEEAELEALYRARRGGESWRTFARQWQPGESQGAQTARRQLELDPAKPMILLCTNVVGDSLALDRQIFTDGMADWLETTVRHLADRPEVQLVVRVHPGELLGAGHPSAEIVRQAAPELPEHVIVVPPESEINTYDLIELAHVGLVYTTTVGMEMAMSGVPVLVSGRTHYRGKGFTFEPETRAEYLDTLDELMAEPKGRRLPQEQIDRARRYAYRFFFEFPFAYPWHVIDFWDDVAERPFRDVIVPPRWQEYAPTLAAMAGASIDWEQERRPEPERVAQ